MNDAVDILLPPLFKPSGEVMSRGQAYKEGKWLGTFNLWVVTNSPEPAIIYQQRGPDRGWAPNLLDVTAGGQYLSGETLLDGLREVKEELGKDYSPKQMRQLGRKVYVGPNTDGTWRHDIVDIFMVQDDEPLDSYHLQAEEVYAICACPIKELLQAHQGESYSFEVTALTATGERKQITVSKRMFPENWDDYHHKIATLADRYFRGERHLVY